MYYNDVRGAAISILSYNIEGKQHHDDAVVWLNFLFSRENRIMSRVVRKQTFCLCENKGADQLRGNREADQRLCFRYLDSTIPLLPKYKISSL